MAKKREGKKERKIKVKNKHKKIKEKHKQERRKERKTGNIREMENVMTKDYINTGKQT